jgi:hypothetical protein
MIEEILPNVYETLSSVRAAIEANVNYYRSVIAANS